MIKSVKDKTIPERHFIYDVGETVNAIEAWHCEKFCMIVKKGFKFDKITACNDTEGVLKTIVTANEIYGCIAIIPFIGYNFGKGDQNAKLFDLITGQWMDSKAKGKKLFLFAEYRSINWQALSGIQIKMAFENNELYTMNSINQDWKRVNIEQLLDLGFSGTNPVVQQAKSVSKKSIKRKK